MKRKIEFYQITLTKKINHNKTKEKKLMSLAVEGRKNKGRKVFCCSFPVNEYHSFNFLMKSFVQEKSIFLTLKSFFCDKSAYQML